MLRRTLADDEVALAWGEWIAGLGEWHLFGGITYRQAPDLVGSHEIPRQMPHPEAVRKHVRGWLGHCNRQLNGRVEAAIVAVEAHKSGWPHAHPLIRLAGGVRPGDVGTLGGAWFERRGYAKLERPRVIADVCEYAAKYLSKDLARGDVVFWPERGPLVTHQLALALRAPGAQPRSVRRHS